MTHNEKHEPIETDQFISTPKKEVEDSQEQSSRGKSISIKKRQAKNQLELSPTPRSPLIKPGTSGRVPKYRLSIAESPPLPARAALESSLPIESPSHPNSIPALSIAPPLSEHQSQPTPSYYTAPSSPFRLTHTPSAHRGPVMGGYDDDIIGNDGINEVPSSIPGENIPPDYWGDAWPATQPTCPTECPESSVSQSSSGQFSDGFRVPGPPPAHISSANSQNESQKSRIHSQRSLPLRYPVRNPLAPFGSQHAEQPSVPDSQDTTQSQEFHVSAHHDQTQSQESDMGQPPTVQKRKREPVIIYLTGHEDVVDPMAGKVETPKKPKMYLEASSDSLRELTESQIPPSMRKAPVTVVNIHSTESQTQDWIAPSRPGPTSQDLTKPLRRDSQASFTSSDDALPLHNWNSTQVTASPLSTQMNLSALMSPPPQTLTSKKDPSSTKEPLDLTLGTMYPLKSEADGLQDIEVLEQMAWKEFDEDEEGSVKRPKVGRA